MKTLCGLAVLALGLWSVTAAWGDVAINGNELLRRCTIAVQVVSDGGVPLSHYEHGDTGYCMGLIHGIANVAHSLSPCAASPYQFCLPGALALGQLLRVVQRYLQTHPARLHLTDYVLVLEALHDAFPCPGASATPRE